MITIVSEGTVLMYDTGTGRNIGFENIFNPQEKYKVQSLRRCAAYHSSILCRAIITPNVYAVSVQVKQGHCLTVSLLSSLSWTKKNPTILMKQSTSRGEKQQSFQHLKMKRRLNKILWTKTASQKSKSKLKNKLEIRLYTGFAMPVI